MAAAIAINSQPPAAGVSPADDATDAIKAVSSKSKDKNDHKPSSSSSSMDPSDRIAAAGAATQQPKSNIPLAPSKYGRKGDPRMHRAVSIRLANPDISLLAALRAGGFVFPDGKDGELEGTVTDSDDVLLCQRKNQLSRRLRLARQGIERGIPFGYSDSGVALESRPWEGNGKGRVGCLNGNVTGAKNMKRVSNGKHQGIDALKNETEDAADASTAPSHLTGEKASTSSGNARNALALEAQARLMLLQHHSLGTQSQLPLHDTWDLGATSASFVPLLPTIYGSPAQGLVSGPNGLPAPPPRKRGSWGSSKRRRGKSDESKSSSKSSSSGISSGIKRQASVLSISGLDEKETLNDDDDDMPEEMAALSTKRMAKNHPLFGNPVAMLRSPALFGLPGGSYPGSVSPFGGLGNSNNAAPLQPNDYAAALSAAAAYGTTSFPAGLPPHSFLAQPSGPQAQLAPHAGAEVMAAQAVAAQQFLDAHDTVRKAQMDKAEQRSAGNAATPTAQPKAGAGGEDNLASTAEALRNVVEANQVDGTCKPGSNNAKAALAATTASLGMSREQLANVLSKGGVGNLLGPTASPPPLAAATFPGKAKAEVKKAEKGKTMNVDCAPTSPPCAPPKETAAQASPTSCAISDDKSQQKKSQQSKMKLALDLYRVESASLLRRCMLMANFEREQTNERDAAYVEFAGLALGAEMERMKILRNAMGWKGCEEDTESKAEVTAPSTYVAVKSTDGPQGQVSKSGRVSQLEGDGGKNKLCKGCGGCLDGRHVHRLEGKCGHRAIIHQPPDGPAHVDFLVDGKVECYQDMQPLKNSEGLWPSRFECDELSCTSGPDHLDHSNVCVEEQCKNDCIAAKKDDPKLLDISDINLEGKEWTFDFSNMPNGMGDETLLGLMGLRDSPKVD